MSNSAVPAIQLSSLYLNNCSLGFATTTTLTIFPGQCRDSTNTFDMNLGNYLGVNPNITADTNTTLNLAVNGVNGLDTGTVAASTGYSVYVIADPVNLKTTATILSLSNIQPTMPFGYSIFRRIGTVFTNSSSQFISFNQAGRQTSRPFQFTTPIAVLTGGASTTAATVNLSTVVPGFFQIVMLGITYTGATAGNTAGIDVGGSTITTIANSPIVVTAQVAAVPFTMVVPMLMTSSQTLTYRVTNASDSLSIEVNGFVDDRLI